MTPTTWPTLGALVLGLHLASCSKKPANAPATDSEAGEEKASSLAVEPEDTTPLEPAAAPPGVFVRARIKSPGALLSSLGQAASSPLDLRHLLLEAEDKAGRVVESIIDVDGSIEALVALHPVSEQEPMMVWSVSTRGVRAALQGLDAEGVDTRQGPEGVHYFDLSGEDCALGRSLGKSPARIVCADRAESLDSLLAYALRGFPAEPLSDSEVAIRAVAEPIQKQYGKQLRGLRLLGGVAARQVHRDHPRFDAAASDAILGIVDEVIAVGEDVQSLSFDLWDRDGAFEADWRLTLGGKSSWLVNTSREWAKAQGPAPELMNQLPADATVVGYFRQPPKRLTERLAKVTSELGAGALEAEGVSRGTADRLARTIGLILAADRTVVYASGPLVAGAGSPRPAWSLIGLDQDRARVLEIIDGFSAVLSDKQVEKLLEAEHRPQLKRKDMKLGAGLTATVYEWRLPESALSALREGTEELAEEGVVGGVVGADAKSLAQLERGYLAVLSRGGTSWIAVASDREGLVDSFRKVQADAPRLASSAEFAAFSAQPALWGSAVRLSGFVNQFAPLLTADTLQTVQSALSVAPHRGAVPVTAFASVTASDTTELRWQMRVPDEFLTDTAALIVALSAEDDDDEDDDSPSSKR